MKDARDLLQMHLLTEKSLVLKEKDNAYVFRVDRKANKVEIRKAIEKVFSVKVKSVRTMIMPSKPKRLGRFSGRTESWKKAIVTLKEGQQIAEFENI